MPFHHGFQVSKSDKKSLKYNLMQERCRRNLVRWERDSKLLLTDDKLIYRHELPFFNVLSSLRGSVGVVNPERLC